jgi:hypothetical protein
MEMNVKLRWSVEVTAMERVVDAHEWSGEVLRGLLNSEMVPQDARISALNEGFGGMAYVVVRWETESEMDLGENYKAS